MSTLGTFSEYADFGLLNDIDQARQRMEPGYADKVAARLQAERLASNPMIQGANPSRVQKSRYSGRRAKVVGKGSPVITRPSAEAKALMPGMKVTKQSEKSKKAVAGSIAEIAKKKGLKMRNLGLGIGLGTAGLVGLGGLALANRRSDRRRSEMASRSSFAQFADEVKPRSKRFVAGGKVYTNEADIPTPLTRSVAGQKGDLTSEELAGIKKASKKADSVMSADDIKSTQERLKKYKGQRQIERDIDAGTGTGYKGVKGMDFVTRTGAYLGAPERALIAGGKNSKNGFVKGLAENAEKFGRLGYKTGAIGGRGVLNKVVGRTGTGKIARLGAAGAALGTIGAVMRNKREQ